VVPLEHFKPPTVRRLGKTEAATRDEQVHLGTNPFRPDPDFWQLAWVNELHRNIDKIGEHLHQVGLVTTNGVAWRQDADHGLGWQQGGIFLGQLARELVDVDWFKVDITAKDVTISEFTVRSVAGWKL
jgi:hypothetical protein